MTGADVRALLENTPEGRHLRDSLFWHMKAAFMSVGAAVLNMPPVEMETEPQPPSAIVDPTGKPYNATGGGNGASGH